MVKSCFCRCEMYSDVCIEMKILILYSAIGSMATVDSALFSSSAIRVIKLVVRSPLHFKPCLLNGMGHIYFKKGGGAAVFHKIPKTIIFPRRFAPQNATMIHWDTAQFPPLRLKHRSGGYCCHGICVAKMLDNVGLRYPHRASGAKAPHALTAGPASVRCFRHWRRSTLQHPVLSALLA